MGVADDWLSIPQIAAVAKVADNTVRRYIGRFPAYFSGKVTDGVMRYPAEVVAAVIRIAELYQTGSTRTEVERILAEEFTATHEPMTDMPATTPAVSAVAVMERMAVALEGLADQKRQIEALAQENQDLKDRVARLETALSSQPGGEAADRPVQASGTEPWPEGHVEAQTPRKRGFWRSIFGGGHAE